MLPRAPAIRLRVLVTVVAALAVGAAFLVPRPGDGTRAVPPSTWSRVPQAVFGPLVTDVPSRAAAPSLPTVPSPGARRKDPEAALIAGAAAEQRANRTSEPPAVRAAPKPPTGPTHVVAAGDNLWTIALRHSASLAAILRWNDGVDADRLVAGQRILVPGGSKMRAAPSPAVSRPAPAKVTRPRAPVPNARAPAAWTGEHVWPLAIRGTISRGFSAAHPGVDIAAPTGTPVRAVAAGTVIWAGWKDNGGGYVVVVRHPDGMRSTYNHNSTVVVEVGEDVDRGETVALVGATGWATGPHLDVRIEMGGRFVNPLELY